MVSSGDASPPRSKRAVDSAWKSSRSEYGTPSNSQITSDGIGSANRCTRSAGAPAASIASSCSAMIASIRGCNRCSRRMVNSGVSSRRNLVWYGGSVMPRPPGSCSSPSPKLPNALLNVVASPSTSLAAS